MSSRSEVEAIRVRDVGSPILVHSMNQAKIALRMQGEKRVFGVSKKEDRSNRRKNREEAELDQYLAEKDQRFIGRIRMAANGYDGMTWKEIATDLAYLQGRDVKFEIIILDEAN